MHIWSKSELARELGITPTSVNYHLKTGNIPEPEIEWGAKRYYSEEQKLLIEGYFGSREGNPRGAKLTDKERIRIQVWNALLGEVIQPTDLLDVIEEYRIERAEEILKGESNG